MPDAETARALFREGGTLLFLNVPIGTLVGLDGQVRVSIKKSKRREVAARAVHVCARAAVSLTLAFLQKERHNKHNKNNRSSRSAPTSWASR